jgi:hypothetical protein
MPPLLATVAAKAQIPPAVMDQTPVKPWRDGLCYALPTTRQMV